MATRVKGLEMQLLMLRDLQSTSLFVGEELNACAECFQTLELCCCNDIKPTVWPVENVIQKLKVLVDRLQTEQLGD